MTEPASPQTIDNEKTRLLAGFFNSAATICIAVGIAGPGAAFFYGLPPAIGPNLFAFFAIVWLLLAAALHLCARRLLNGLLAT
jgi:hypothetical protein